jgi:GDP-4-dehydro-6-deoxy-D-mannose reductase
VFVESAFAKQIAEIEAEHLPPTVYVGNLASVRTWLDVRDIVRAYWLALEVGVPGDVYNIGGNTTLTVGEMLDMLLALSPKGKTIEVKVSQALLRPSDVTLQVPSVAKFKLQTGWEPEIPIRSTFSDLLDYWRAEVAKP